MINALLTGIMNLILSLVSVLLKPIDLLISTVVPDFSTAINGVASMLEYALQFVGFVIDATGISSATISLIVLYYGFALVVPLGVSAVKTAIKWYNALKP